MRNRWFIGVDPGASGAIAILDADSEVIGVIKNSATPADLHAFLAQYQLVARMSGLIEQVSAMPKQGVASTFKFGWSYGLLTGLLVCNQVSFEKVTPQTWQREMKCLSGGDKNVTKQAAQSLWPKERITHATADALLLAECCRRRHLR